MSKEYVGDSEITVSSYLQSASFQFSANEAIVQSAWSFFYFAKSKRRQLPPLVCYWLRPWRQSAHMWLVDLQRLTLKTSLAFPTHVMTVCGKFEVSLKSGLQNLVSKKFSGYQVFRLLMFLLSLFGTYASFRSFRHSGRSTFPDENRQYGNKDKSPVSEGYRTPCEN